MQNKLKQSLGLLICLFSLHSHGAKVEIPFWHSLPGHLGKVINQLANDFNKTHVNYKVVPIYKGSYTESFTSFAAAYRSDLHPPLVQVQEISTATMLESKQLTIPIYKLMQTNPINGFKSELFLKSLRNYYGNGAGQLLALPFNSSSAVLYYNRTIFDKAGIKNPPLTWQDVALVSKKLLDKKLTACGFTTAFPSWVNIESFTQWHGLSFIENESPTKLKVNYQIPALTYHLQKLFDWHKQGIYKYAGRDSNATSLFTSGHCAMFIHSSGSYNSLKKTSEFKVDVSSLPYWPQYRKHNFNGTIGGAALWVINGFDKKTYQGISQFLAFLSSKEKQALWQEETGYFPVLETPKVTNLNTANLKASKIAFEQVSKTNKLTKVFHMPHYSQIRLFNDEQIEAILSELLSVDEALKQSSDYANKFLPKS